MMKAPQQELFDELFKYCLLSGVEVYDFKPNAKAKYPFIEFEQTQELTIPTKTDRTGKISVVVNVWGDAKNRNKVSQLAEGIFCAKELKGKEKNYSLNCGSSSISLMKDTSTNTTLYRALVSLEYYF